jgi:hypothetical protein
MPMTLGYWGFRGVSEGSAWRAQGHWAEAFWRGREEPFLGVNSLQAMLESSYNSQHSEADTSGSVSVSFSLFLAMWSGVKHGPGGHWRG